MEHDTFFGLLTDPAHWGFEIVVIIVFDIFIGLLLWPYFKKAILHHKSDDERIAELERKVEELSKR